MTLFINNQIVADVLTMQDTIDALDTLWRDAAEPEAALLS